MEFCPTVLLAWTMEGFAFLCIRGRYILLQGQVVVCSGQNANSIFLSLFYLCQVKATGFFFDEWGTVHGVCRQRLLTRFKKRLDNHRSMIMMVTQEQQHGFI